MYVYISLSLYIYTCDDNNDDNIHNIVQYTIIEHDTNVITICIYIYTHYNVVTCYSIYVYQLCYCTNIYIYIYDSHTHNHNTVLNIMLYTIT